MAAPGTALTVINGGMNRLRIKGAARSDTLYLLQDGYVTAANTVKKRPGTIRNADLSVLGGSGNSKGLVAFQNALHVFSAQKVLVPAGYVDHVLTHPASQATYTPPNPVSPGINGWANYTVQSLLHFEDGNGSTAITDSGANPSAWTAFNGAAESTAQSTFGSGSLSWHPVGTNTKEGIQTAAIATGGILDIFSGNGDFTVEFWFMPNANGLTGGHTWEIFSMVDVALTYGIRIRQNGNSVICDVYANSARTVNQNGQLTASAWNHVAVTRSKNRLAIYVNGVGKSSAASGSQQGDFAGAVPANVFATVGRAFNSGESTTDVYYIDEVRITKGAALYAMSFTPPATALNTAPSPVYTITSLLHFDDGAGSTAFTDAGNLTWTAHGAAAESLTQFKLGTGSGAFLASSGADYISTAGIANDGIDFENENCDYTFECFYYPTDIGVGNSHVIMDLSTHAGVASASRFLIKSVGQNLEFDDFSAMGYGNTTVNALFTAANTWYHIAVVRWGNAYRVFVNGTLQITLNAATSGNTVSAGTNVWGIGSKAGATLGAQAYIDEFRGVRGLAIYKANFVPPAAPYTAPGFNQIALKEIHFAAPFMGFLYVVAEFATDGGTGLGTVFHYWLQTSGTWAANTIYQAGQIISPVTANGLTYKAVRLKTPNPSWAPSTLEALNNIVEPTVANGYKFTATKIDGLNPLTGSTEPTWPTTDGATVVEETERTNTGIVTTAAPQPTATTPSPGIGFGAGGKYGNIYSGSIIR